MTDTFELVVREDPVAQRELIAVAGFLAGYRTTTRTSYRTDLRIFTNWCHEAGLTLFVVKRAHLELFGRWMEHNGLIGSTVARRISTLASFYRYCEQEELMAKDPAINVRRPKIDNESRTLGLDRNELGAFLVQAGLGSPRDHPLASLLALNGLRISEALGADIEDLDYQRGHRTLKIVRKGNKHATIPLAPRTSRALDLIGPGFRGGSRPLNEDGSYEDGCEEQADDAAVLAGAEGAGGADGVRAARGVGHVAGHGETCRWSARDWSRVAALVGEAGRDRFGCPAGGDVG